MHLGISITILPVAILYSPADMREQEKNHPVTPITRIFLWTILEFDIQMYDVPASLVGSPLGERDL